MVDCTHTQADTNTCMEKHAYAPSHKCIEVNFDSCVSHTILLSTYMFMLTQYSPLPSQRHMYHEHIETRPHMHVNADRHIHACIDKHTDVWPLHVALGLIMWVGVLDDNISILVTSEVWVWLWWLPSYYPAGCNPTCYQPYPHLALGLCLAD